MIYFNNFHFPGKGIVIYLNKISYFLKLWNDFHWIWMKKNAFHNLEKYFSFVLVYIFFTLILV